MSNLSPQSKGYSKDLADSGIEIAAKNISIQVNDNAEIIQTKATGPEPAINNSVARFVGTDGTTIQSSTIVVDDTGDVGVGTTVPDYQMDIRTVGVVESQTHVASTDTDAGGYLSSYADTVLFASGGAAYDASQGTVAKATEASFFGTANGQFFVTSNGGLTPGNTFVTNKSFQVFSVDSGVSAACITAVANSTYSRLMYPASNIAPPSFSTRSNGAKIVLYPLTGASTADVAIGVDTNVMWFGHIDSNASRLFKWYGGTTEVMRLQGDGELHIKAGGASGFAKVGGVIFDHYADANNSGTTETDLYSDTLPASALNTNGDKLFATYQVQCTGAALASQDMRLYFGGTKIYDSGALSIGAITSNFTFEVTIIRVSATVVRCSVAVSSDFATLFPYSTYTEVTGLTLTNTQILKITGQASGAGGASSQITAKLGTVIWYPEA